MKNLLSILFIACTAGLMFEPVMAQSETREVEDFNSIDFDGVANLTVRLGSENSVMVTAPEGRAGEVETGIDGRWLEISTPDTVRSGTYQIDIVTRELREVILDGASTAEFGDISGDQFVLDARGASEIVLGAIDADNIELYLQGAVDLVSRAIRTENLALEMGGAVDANLGRIEAPNAYIDGSGAGTVRASGNIDNLDIYLYGASEFVGNDLEVQNLSGEVSLASDVRIDRVINDLMQYDSVGDFDFDFDFGGEFNETVKQAMLIGLVSTVLVFLVPLLIVLALLWNGHRKRKMMHETIRIYAENDRELPPELLQSLAGNMRTTEQQIRRGTMQLAVGIGLAAFLLLVGAPEAAGIGILIACIGGARLYSGKTEQQREDARNAG